MQNVYIRMKDSFRSNHYLLRQEKVRRCIKKTKWKTDRKRQKTLPGITTSPSWNSYLQTSGELSAILCRHTSHVSLRQNQLVPKKPTNELSTKQTTTSRNIQQLESLPFSNAILLLKYFSVPFLA